MRGSKWQVKIHFSVGTSSSTPSRHATCISAGVGCWVGRRAQDADAHAGQRGTFSFFEDADAQDRVQPSRAGDVRLATRARPAANCTRRTSPTAPECTAAQRDNIHHSSLGQGERDKWNHAPWSRTRHHSDDREDIISWYTASTRSMRACSTSARWDWRSVLCSSAWSCWSLTAWRVRSCSS